MPVGVSNHAASVVEQVAKRRVHLVSGLLSRPVQRLAGIVLAITHYGYVRNSKEHVGEVLHEEGPQRQRLALLIIGR